ncbi:Two component system histidine kinase [Desulfonema limicola]|uniref:histidine kinase n=1 Tax=Desulfonema limicola TaxID=45656 RepID=A0A975B6J1_9BACT|nr:ATP-binding protein [Desulfonema limicola]QTA79685.1 Two component system histidine kinase [Desulfonema limicola]
MPEKLKFKISSALKNVIGRDLITDDFVAIFELVKNSFDAFASKVIIQFDFQEESGSKIYIIDDGKGMNYNDIIEKWLFVAFSAKKEGTEDKISRTYAGNKGVGRFSCDRLGRTLKIQSKTKNDKTIHCLDINWEDFEKNSKEEFIEVDVTYTESKAFSLPVGLPVNESGVVLEIGNLRHADSWNRDKLIGLKRSLEKLLDPMSGIETQKDIEIKCGREKNNDVSEVMKAVKKDREPITVNGFIKNTIFQVLENKTTVMKAKITDEHKLQVELIDRGVFIYKTEEDISDIFPNLIDSGFYTEISYLNRSAKQTFALRMGVPSVQYGSIFLIMNGFRVFPIGEDGNDYWGLNRRKQQQYNSYVGSREILGFVKIQGGNDRFRESSSRNQGLIQTQAAVELTECFIKCIRKFEAYVADITWKDKLDKEEIDFNRMGLDSNRIKIIQLIEKLSKSKNITVLDYNHDLISILDEKSKEFEPSLKNLKNIADNINDEKLSKQIDLAEKALIKAKKAEQEAKKAADQEKKAREKAEKIVKEIEKEKEVIEEAYEEEKKRSLFLTGSNMRDKELLECFIHQIILYASNSKESLKNILQSPTRFNNVTGENLRNLLENLLETIEKIISTSRFATTANFRLNSSMITEDFNSFMYEYLEKIAVAYNTRIKIHTNLDKNEFKLHFNPIEMGMVFENFISNSKKARASNITFTSILKSGILTITIEDDGSGLDKNITGKDRIFEKGFTRTKGSGLGLYFCKTRIESLGGELKISGDQPRHGLSFTIRISK